MVKGLDVSEIRKFIKENKNIDWLYILLYALHFLFFEIIYKQPLHDINLSHAIISKQKPYHKRII